MREDLLTIETLDRLSRQEGVDVRPILVRVLTDLYVQKPHHAPEEIARYEELALQLLDVVSVETRATVARKLAEDPRAPHAVIRRLLDDDATVATPIIARFRDVPRHDLLTLALDGGAVEAAAVARRGDLDDDMVRILAHHPDDLVLETLAANPAARPVDATLANMVARAMASPPLAAALLRRHDLDDAALAPLYLVADPDRRAAIREAIAARPARATAAPRALRRASEVDAALVEAATHSSRGGLIAEALGEALSLPPATAAWLAAEPSGEPFVMMLRAVDLAPQSVARALLVAQPEIAQSVTRFYDLVDLADATPRAAAYDLLSAIAGTAPAATPARYEPAFDPSGTPERSGAARPAARVRRVGTRVEANRSRN